ncbi:hypothetical protein [Povalibacter sp.]|uniref:hypothetical protein n=1 Tax=Povalibacter sp. TaxID=1962978 RepID=UPI002F41B2DF
MAKPSSVSRRLKSCITYLQMRDYEQALIHLFPALDKTAKRRRPKQGVGDRIRNFVADEEAMITAVATRNIFQNIRVNDVSFPEAIYKFGRTAISHEGELDPRLQFNDSRSLQIGSVWNLPSSYITGLCVAVMAAPENMHESIDAPLSLAIFDRKFQINELWGAKSEIQGVICKAFRNPNLFDPAQQSVATDRREDAAPAEQ